ncbi:MAG: DUF1887 family protein [Victivallales bacterium]|nr:DUF1887 family protein [Victivallales bacterium]
MDNPKDSRFHKTVIINRAVSGSGKTTLSRCVTEALTAKGLTVGVHSTDNFFMKGNRYVFELDKLNAYHARNLAEFIDDLERGTDVVICDNMNLLPWQSEPYTAAARKYRYRILFLNFLPRELEKHLAAQVVTPEKPDAHGLSREILERFIRNFNDYNDLLDKNTVRDIKRHHVFVWNDIEKKAMDTGELAQYFDSDAVITIRPEEYQEMKKTLADSVLRIISESDEELKQIGKKRHYLLTWYGITDIRAALGLEPSDGPVMGALRTGNYSDAIILGYTNPNKPQDAFSGALRSEWEKLRSLSLEERLAYPRAKSQVMVDAVCNTETGHSMFLNFIDSAKLPVMIHFMAKELAHLNDARAIDAAARSALRLALTDDSDKDLTCFLSPGTPVMAYTWAMVSRTNPNLNLRVISSSDPRKPPEEIDLPKDVLSPSIITSRSVIQTEFDVIIHLLGNETNIPQFFCIVQFPARKHLFITSAESKKSEALKSLLPEGVAMELRIVDPFVPGQTRKAIEGIVQSLPLSTRIGVNLTGGTKLMFAGGLNACNEYQNTEPFYFDIKRHNITFIRSGISIPFKGVRTIDGFLKASGYDIVTRGYWDDRPARAARSEVTRKLWERRELFNELFLHCREYKEYKPPKPGKPSKDFEFSISHFKAVLRGNKASLEIDGQKMDVPDCTDFAFYLGGGWLEEYAYLQLSQLQESGLIFDLRIGVEIAPTGQVPKNGEMPFAEFDCAFSDGRRLFIVECKECPVTQNHIQKLENNLKLYGGIAARGILFQAVPLQAVIQRRIDTSTAIRALPESDASVSTLNSLVATSH